MGAGYSKLLGLIAREESWAGLIAYYRRSLHVPHSSVCSEEPCQGLTACRQLVGKGTTPTTGLMATCHPT